MILVCEQHTPGAECVETASASGVVDSCSQLRRIRQATYLPRTMSVSSTLACDVMRSGRGSQVIDNMCAGILHHLECSIGHRMPCISAIRGYQAEKLEWPLECNVGDVPTFQSALGNSVAM